MEEVIVEETVVHGMSIRTNNANEMNPSTGKIAQLWQNFDDTVAVNYQGGERVYGIYSHYESDHTGDFNVLAGFNGNLPSKNLSLEQFIIPAGQYLVFTKKGKMPQIAFDVWGEIWAYFLKENVEHKRNFLVDFEYYPGPDEIKVHIGVS